MILSDGSIIELCMASGKPVISPFNIEKVQPASVDVTLGAGFIELTGQARPGQHIDLNDPKSYEGIAREVPGTSYILYSGRFVLGATEEYFNVPDYLKVSIEGKSSIGRMGLTAHITAGYVDPGFSGRLTLEMANLGPKPIILRAGADIAQISFALLDKPAVKPYNGRYQGDQGVAATRYGQEKS